MEQTQFEKMRKKLKDELDKERYQHTMGVMYTASSLAMCYGEDLDKAMFAGLLHDCAKCIPHDKKFELCAKYGITVTPVERDNPGLLHAKLGAEVAKRKYGIKDEEICHAIKVHTTGCPNMNLLDKILYIADYIEPHRNEAPNLDELRRLAFHDLDGCLFRMLEDSLEYIRFRKFPIDPMTEETYKYYKEQLAKGGKQHG